MLSADNPNCQNRRHELRVQGRTARRETPNREELSSIITSRLLTLPEFTKATEVLFYVHLRDEVQTIDAIAQAFSLKKRVAVPYCLNDELELFALQSMDDLAPGAFGVLEPKFELRKLPERQVRMTQISLAVVPGVAFDRHGGRLGYGKGYYDKLLALSKNDTTLVGLAFDSQIFDEVPMESHDIPMDLVITQTHIYQCNSHKIAARRT